MKNIAVIGGGPAGLMAAEVLAASAQKHELQVTLFDAMPSVGRKFLLAGIGGMNITHSEPFEPFISRYGVRAVSLAPTFAAFTPTMLRDWVHGLGIETFIGSSGRVFPTDMKAAPLLRAWLQRLRAADVQFHVRHRWLGWTDTGALRFATPQGEIAKSFDAVVLALGGASWPQLGSDGAWVSILAASKKSNPTETIISPLVPANCGFDIAGGWSEHLQHRFAGQPVKTVALSFLDADGQIQQRKGELMLSDTGLEGSLMYAISAPLREAIAARGCVILTLDLLPDKSLERVLSEIAHPRGARSFASHLQSRAGIHGVKMALLRELCSPAQFNDPAQLATAIKALPLKIKTTRPLQEAISTAGGVRFEALNEHLMLHHASAAGAIPTGVFCAGEMLDWEAPTGGYLLSACFATGRQAGQGVLKYLSQN